MTYPLDIHIWPHETFAYYSKGHHSVRHFREQLHKGRGVAVGVTDGDWDFCYARIENGELVPHFVPNPGAFPVTIWSLA